MDTARVPRSRITQTSTDDEFILHRSCPESSFLDCPTTADASVLVVDDKYLYAKTYGKSAGWGILEITYNDMPTIMKCSEVIANCTLCADYNQCLACDDTDLLVNKFKTKLNETYIYCTSSLNY